MLDEAIRWIQIVENDLRRIQGRPVEVKGPLEWVSYLRNLRFEGLDT